MQIAILILLAAVIVILLWLIFQSMKKTVDPSISLMQQEVQSLRGQLTEAMLKSQETVNQQLGPDDGNEAGFEFLFISHER